MNPEEPELISNASDPAGLKIRVIGIGGAGTNAVAKLELEDSSEVSLAAVNTDAQALADKAIPQKRVIGQSVTHGLSAGGDIEIGRAAAEADREALSDLVKGMDLVILVVGLGGGTGSALAPVLSKLALADGATVLAFATIPFTFEGARRKQIADESQGELRKCVHGLITLQNDILLQECGEGAGALDTFSIADQWIGRGISSICSMLLKIGVINQDFTAFRSIFSNPGGRALFGTGSAQGDDYVNRALDNLLLCPLLHMGDHPSKLDRIWVNFIGSPDLQVAQMNEIMSEISKRFDLGKDVIFGAVIDPHRTNSLEICLLGKSGLEPNPRIEATTATGQNILDVLAPEAQITNAEKPARAVHRSKLQRKKKASSSHQDEFTFIEMDAHRGYFDNTDRNLYNDEDLDVPTYLRKGIKIKIKA